MATLYLSDPTARLRLRSGRLQAGTLDVPLAHVDGLVVLGPCQVSTQVIQYLLRHGGSVVWAEGTGRLLGVTWASPENHTDLHLKQARLLAATDLRLPRAVALVQAKIAGQAHLLGRYQRRRSNPAAQDGQPLHGAVVRAARVTSLDELRGVEGAAARRYFMAWRRMVGAGWQFEKRQHRSPTDAVNVLLNFVYGLLYRAVAHHVAALGLHPGIGVLHDPRNGHPALVSDLVEPWRAPVAETCLLDAIRHRWVTPEDVTAKGTGMVLRVEARRTIVRSFERRLAQPHRTAGGQTISYREAIEEGVRQHVSWVRATL